MPWSGHLTAAASKGGRKLLMETLAQEMGAKKIRANGVASGAIEAAINEKSGALR
jgi:glucose 1-dehydrogenase